MNGNNWAGERIFLFVCLFLFFVWVGGFMFVVNPFTAEFMMAILAKCNNVVFFVGFFVCFFCCTDI